MSWRVRYESWRELLMGSSKRSNTNRHAFFGVCNFIQSASSTLRRVFCGFSRRWSVRRLGSRGFVGLGLTLGDFEIHVFLADESLNPVVEQRLPVTLQ